MQNSVKQVKESLEGVVKENVKRAENGSYILETLAGFFNQSASEAQSRVKQSNGLHGQHTLHEKDMLIPWQGKENEMKISRKRQS